MQFSRATVVLTAAIVAIATVVFISPALAGLKACSNFDNSDNGANVGCGFSPSSTGVCTVSGAFVRHSAGAVNGSFGHVECILSGGGDFVVFLSLTSTNATDGFSLSLGPAGYKGSTGTGVNIECINTPNDFEEVSMFGSCS